MENLFIRWDIFTKFGINYCRRLNCSDRTTTTDSLHTNDDYVFSFSYTYTCSCYKKCTCEGYYSFGAAEIHVFPCCDFFYFLLIFTLQFTKLCIIIFASRHVIIKCQECSQILMRKMSMLPWHSLWRVHWIMCERLYWIKICLGHPYNTILIFVYAHMFVFCWFVLHNPVSGTDK